MTPDALILALDAGSQSVRASLIDGSGTLRAIVRHPLQAPPARADGWSELDADALFSCVIENCQRLREEHPELWPGVAGLALTGQRASIVFVDANGQPLRPAILWSDRRRTLNLGPLGGVAGLGIALAGAASTVSHLRAEAEVNWVATHEPQVWAATHKVLLLTSYLAWRLTGVYKDSAASQVAYLPFDFRHHRWHRRGNWRWRALGRVRRRQMIDLCAPGTPIAPVTDALATQLGLRRGTSLIASAADKACETLGAGCLGPAQACLSYGTAATVNVPNSRYVQTHRFAPAYPSAVPKGYLTEIQIHRGFWLVSWFMREFGHEERGRAERAGVEPETLLEELLDASPPGAAGLVAQPYFAPGIRQPGPEARGALIGFNDQHTRAHVYRALVEGVAFALHEGLALIERRGKLRVTNLRVAGGGANSRAIMQMTADVFGLPATRPTMTEASSLGAAICAAVGLRWYSSYAAAVQGMCHSGEVFTPDAANHRLYRAIIEDIYRPMYARLKPLYHAMRAVAP